MFDSRFRPACSSCPPLLAGAVIAGTLGLPGCVGSFRAKSPQTAAPISGSTRSERMSPMATPDDGTVMAAANPVLPAPDHDAPMVRVASWSQPVWEEEAPPATRNAPPVDLDPSLISLYGNELIGSRDNTATPFDGSANTRQVSFATEGSTFDPHVDRTGKWLLFASTRHRSTADIYMKSVEGTAVTQITADPGHDVMPSLDPTGRKVAFASDRSGTWDIYYKPVAGGQPVKLTSDEDAELHPTWSPDGRHLAYCKYGRKTARWEIWVIDVTNPSTPSFLTFGVFPVWSPDVMNSKLLFQRARQRGSHFHSIWTIDFHNGEAHRPTEVVSAGNAALINPAWSPDGKKIVFVSVVDPEIQPKRPTQSDVWCINTDGTERTNLTNGRFANYQPVWASSGTIYFVSNRSGVDNIWAVTTNTLDSGTPSMAGVDTMGGQP